MGQGPSKEESRGVLVAALQGKAIWPQGSTINNHLNTGTTTATHHSLPQLEHKVREDTITKENLMNKIKVLTKQLHCVCEELVIFFNKWDRKVTNIL